MLADFPPEEDAFGGIEVIVIENVQRKFVPWRCVGAKEQLFGKAKCESLLVLEMETSKRVARRRGTGSGRGCGWRMRDRMAKDKVGKERR